MSGVPVKMIWNVGPTLASLIAGCQTSLRAIDTAAVGIAIPMVAPGTHSVLDQPGGLNSGVSSAASAAAEAIAADPRNDKPVYTPPSHGVTRAPTPDMTFQNPPPPPPPPNSPDEDVGAGVVAGRGADVAVAKVVRGAYGMAGAGTAAAVGVY